MYAIEEGEYNNGISDTEKRGLDEIFELAHRLVNDLEYDVESIYMQREWTRDELIEEESIPKNINKLKSLSISSEGSVRSLVEVRFQFVRERLTVGLKVGILV